MEPERDEVTGKLTTGHVWDGIKELNTPMPGFVKVCYWASVVFAVGYWILMPAWPYVSDYTRGVLGYQQRSVVTNQVVQAKGKRAAWESKLVSMSYADIKSDQDLHTRAITSGKALFGNNCAVCHGFSAEGQKRFPTLSDKDWLWGGSVEAIERTIRVGINAGHEETQAGEMLAFGKDEVLDRQQVKDVIEYVLSLSDGAHETDRAARGAPAFAENCASCHGEKGRGSYETGAPNLTDKVWLYGGDRDTLWQTIFYGRRGVMPHWDERFDAPTIKSLALYVHSLGGGEPAAK